MDDFRRQLWEKNVGGIWSTKCPCCKQTHKDKKLTRRAARHYLKQEDRKKLIEYMNVVEVA